MNNMKKTKKIQIEFDAKHIPVLVSALEAYSRLKSGQVRMAMMEVYADRHITYDEAHFIENAVRYIAFPHDIKREYDGHGSFYDQYDNVYDESGSITEESEKWKKMKARPHLDSPNSSLGVGCKEMADGTIAWEIKKAIEEYLNYERNGGYRDTGVDGNGVLNLSGVPNARILDANHGYWKPQKVFKIPLKHQKQLSSVIEKKQYDKAWEIVDASFKNKKLPLGSGVKIEKIDTDYCIIIEKPFKRPNVNSL